MDNTGFNCYDDMVLLATSDQNIKAVWDRNRHKITGFWDNGIYKESNQADQRLQMLARTAYLKERGDLKRWFLSLPRS